MYAACVRHALPVLSALARAHSQGQCALLPGEMLYSFGLSVGQRCRRMVWATLAHPDPHQKAESLDALVHRMDRVEFDIPSGEWFFRQCAGFSKGKGDGPDKDALECSQRGMHKLLATLFQHTTVLPTNPYRTKYGPWLDTLPWSPSWLSACVEQQLPAMAAAIMRLGGGGGGASSGGPKLTRADFESPALRLSASVILGFGAVNLACHRQFMALREEAAMEVSVVRHEGGDDLTDAPAAAMLQVFTLCNSSCPADLGSMIQLGSGEALLPGSASALPQEHEQVQEHDGAFESLSLIATGAGNNRQRQALHALHLTSPFTGSSDLSLLADSAPSESSPFQLRSAAAFADQSDPELASFFPLLLRPRTEFFDLDPAEPVLVEVETALGVGVHPTQAEADQEEWAAEQAEEHAAFVETDTTLFAANSALHRALHRARNGATFKSRARSTAAATATATVSNPHIPEQPEKGYELSGEADGGPVANKAANNLEDSAALQLRVALRVALEDNLMMQVNRTTSRTLSRQLTKRLTIALTESVTRKLLASLSRPIVETTTRLLLHSLTPTLTFSLSAAIAPSLTRTPHEDYYCWFCKTQQQYCAYCKASRGNIYYQDYYRNHYAGIYSNYYGKYYALSVDIAQFIDSPEKLDGGGAGGEGGEGGEGEEGGEE